MFSVRSCLEHLSCHQEVGGRPRANTAAGLGAIGWHTMRHSYRSWLDETGAPLTVQQNLMRHADIRTTMNIYGDAIPDTLRAAHGKVVRMALRPPVPRLAFGQ